MIKFAKPNNLNGETLIIDLRAAGITLIPNEVNSIAPVLDAEGNLWLRISETDRAKAQAVLDSHSG